MIVEAKIMVGFESVIVPLLNFLLIDIHDAIYVEFDTCKSN